MKLFDNNILKVDYMRPDRNILLDLNIKGETIRDDIKRILAEKWHKRPIERKHSTKPSKKQAFRLWYGYMLLPKSISWYLGYEIFFSTDKVLYLRFGLIQSWSEQKLKGTPTEKHWSDTLEILKLSTGKTIESFYKQIDILRLTNDEYQDIIRHNAIKIQKIENRVSQKINTILMQYTEEIKKKIGDIADDYKKFFNEVQRRDIVSINKEPISHQEYIDRISYIIKAINTKPFIILSGISGTGKTQIARIISVGLIDGGKGLI